jgi:Dolichyl-phosphate-mannose-protein mannosyltransferase
VSVGGAPKATSRVCRRVDSRRRWAFALLALLSAQFIGFGLWEAWGDAPTNDEPVTIAAGVTALTRHDLRINTEHPPLPKVLAALPVLAANPVIPNDSSWRRASGAFTEEFIRANRNAGKLHMIVFLARLIPLLEGLLVGLAAYALASALFGRASGLIAAGAWLTTSVAIGFSHLDGLDIPMALVAMVACIALVRHLRHPTWGSCVTVGLIGGTALLTRWTGLALVPVLALVVAIAARRGPRRAFLQGAAVLLVAWGTLWVGYRLIAPSTTPVVNGVLVDLHRANAVPPSSFADVFIDHIPLPKEYTAGLREQRVIERVIERGRAPAFLLGHYWNGDRWWFWPGTLLVKLPVSLLVLFAVSPVAWWVLDRRRIGPALLTVALPATVLLLGTYSQAPQTIGIRYLLPIIALACVAASAIAVVAPRHGIVRGAAAIAIAIQLLFFYSAVPSSLAWTAPPFRPGYRVAADSNLDLGQDFYRLQAWSRGRHPWIAWFGPIPGSVISGSKNLLGADLQSIRGYVATNASTLTLEHHNELSWLRAYCPTATLGGTILIYRFREPPDPRPGPDAPARTCPGSESHRV